ncbi:YhjD/YihY/BrkB family envelope integrity protein [Motilibacter aurantiacus]|uniref:YhjD/YihY/BrkB family envelope integrity protein n=1 Tax=Motilibacter aurantiacus TaxID=2714955 RepID=UPI0014076E36|nr:YhjD/YihY/BrkB family envelope integrity protein [Motilibacter aurantiacus]NHC44154.1 YihY/virulence factor BrkB family protein [Motilibacter aurantiacus]
MSLTERLDRFQRRHPAAGFPLAVVYKFFDDHGNYLAALITYYVIVAVLPVLLLLSTLLSVLLDNYPELQVQVRDSALSQFPVIGPQLQTPEQLSGGTAGVVIAVVVGLYGGTGAAQAVQHAMNTAWRVPRNSRPNPIMARLRGLLLLATLGLAVLGTTVLSALGATAGSYGADLDDLIRVLVLLASVVVNTGVFLLAFLVATARRLRVRDIAPGAVAAAVVWQLLQTFGAVYVGRVVKAASDTNGVFALMLGLIAFVYLAAMAVVLCVELNVVRVDRLHPRALLTPFTDAVDLTPGDKAAYTTQAQAQRAKGFEEVDVTFRPRS